MNTLFNRETHCAKCRRFIDEKIVKLKKITIGPDTYRQTNEDYLSKVKYEKICTDCFHGVRVIIKEE